MTEFEMQQRKHGWERLTNFRTSPDYIVQAREDYLQAWGFFDRLVDRKIDGEDIEQAVIDAAQDIAADLELKYNHLHRLWQDSVGAGECVCNERHICPACIAKSNLTAALVAGGHEVEIPF